MKIVQYDDVEWKRGLQHRGGTFHYRHLLNGTPGTLGNFQFNIGQLEGDFASPRHRHNFDQFRIQLEGTMNFDRNGKMEAGTFGYFPEGAPYGPQSSDGKAVTAVLQFGSASGSGYLSREEVFAGQNELIMVVKVDREAQFADMVDMLDELHATHLTRFSITPLEDKEKAEVEKL